MLRKLNRDGIAITSASALFGGDDDLKELKAAVDRLQDDLAERLDAARLAANDPDASGKKPFFFRLLGDTDPLLIDDGLRADNVYVRYPLQGPIPRIADAYFRMYARLYDYNVWYNFATQLPPRQSQRCRQHLPTGPRTQGDCQRDARPTSGPHHGSTRRVRRAGTRRRVSGSARLHHVAAASGSADGDTPVAMSIPKR